MIVNVTNQEVALTKSSQLNELVTTTKNAVAL